MNLRVGDPAGRASSIAGPGQEPLAGAVLSTPLALGRDQVEAARERRETSVLARWSPAFAFSLPRGWQVGGLLPSEGAGKDPWIAVPHPYVAGWREGGPTATRQVGDAS